MMKKIVKLTKREKQVTELFAWGASKKEVASQLFVSERTVENHARNIYQKTGCNKVNELSAWWFCTTFHISFDLSPIRRRVVAMFLLALMIPQLWRSNTIVTRTFKGRTARTCRLTRRNPEPEPFSLT